MTVSIVPARHDGALGRRRRFFGPLTRIFNPFIRRIAGDLDLQGRNLIPDRIERRFSAAQA